MTERYIRARDVAEMLDVSVETVLRWHRSGKLPGGHRLGSNVLRFSESEVLDWLEGQRVNGPSIRAVEVLDNAPHAV